CTSYDGSFAYW
nr:immunoglobulin heavy chain junction region [Mus musculus]